MQEDRSRRGLLDRPTIVAAAIAVADDVDPAEVTMKAVAARLGQYTAMSLYRHVRSRDGLIDLMLDAAAAEVPVPVAPGPDWRGDIVGYAAAARRMIKRHGWYARLVHTRPPLGRHQLAQTEFLLAVLHGQGADDVAAMTFASLVDRHVVGSALQEVEEDRMNHRLGIAEPAALADAFASVHEMTAADGQFPHLTQWLAQPAGPTADERFALGLDCILDGIARRLPAY